MEVLILDLFAMSFFGISLITLTRYFESALRSNSRLLLRNLIAGSLLFTSLHTKANSDFQISLGKILALNEPTVITEMRVWIDSEDMINEKTIMDPIARFSSYQLGILYALYSRPLAITNHATYKSEVFSRFSYDQLANKLSLIVANNNKFSDGSPITADDVAATIARVAYFRTSLSPYDRIAGISSWKEQKQPLSSYPSGIRVLKNPERIEIIFSEKPEHPYYWLTFPMVSIIPKSCIDAKTGSCICQTPPSSGDYKLEKVSRNLATLKRWTNNQQAPNKMHIAFVSEEDIPFVLDNLRPMHVFDVHDGSNFSGGVEARVKSEFRSTGFTQNHILFMTLDPKTTSFQYDHVRYFFAAEVRKTLESMGKEVTGSMIPVLNPGYLTLENLKAKTIVDENKMRHALQWLKHHPPSIAEGSMAKTNLFFVELIRKTCDRLEVAVATNKLGSISFRKISYESIDPLHAARFVLTYGPAYQGVLPHALFSLIGSISKANPELTKQIIARFFSDATLSALMAFGHQQIVRKDSLLKFKEQFLRQDWQRFFEGKAQ